MPKRIPARLAVLSLLALTGGCSVVKSYLPNDKDATPVATAAGESDYALPTQPYQPAPQVQTRPVVDRSYVTEYDPNPVAVPIKPGAPERYTVVRGDTLWDISGLYLDDPWLWPEIWHVNPQIENPHLIYPGDILSLVWVDGRPQLRLERDPVSADVRLSPQPRYQSLDEAITTIPYDVIASFLSKPRLLDKKTIKNAPY
ncbi:MAG: LysM peptidoglycan-binding domain-containing protein, partial [Gammaproteobacteria bacterium]|nr:LysM peptidoglycan-binding domain-containing protein [Gammaproteobacteria bacterium]